MGHFTHKHLFACVELGRHKYKFLIENVPEAFYKGPVGR